MRLRSGHSIALMIAGALACAAVGGCAGPVVPSQRMGHAGVVKTSPVQRHGYLDPVVPVSCTDRQRLEEALPYFAGPFLPQGTTPGEPTIQPPHSKFHPVPTRPVFAPRADASPPQPVGIDLVPLPERGLEFVPPDQNNEPILPEFNPSPSS